ncbi:hypothetical protein EJB05_03553, partial [Eragrostis curvula]
MSRGGAGQPSCTTVPLGKVVRRTLRAAVGMKKKKKKKPKGPAAECIGGGGVSMERLSSFSAKALGPATKESVVRVVLKSGVVEVYPGVVLACTVIRKHPPGLCLAHPDVFRNPHGAVVRPLEPLFPGQKFLLLPETTVIRLKQKIPESSIDAFADDDEVTASTDAEESDKDYSSGATASSSEEEWDTAAGDGDCMAREFYEANDRWSQCHFKKLVRRGLAMEQQSKEPERKDKAKKKGKKRKRKGKKKRKDRRVTAPAGLRMFAIPRRTWEPSLPAVEEEEAAVSPLCTSSEATTEDREQ